VISSVTVSKSFTLLGDAVDVVQGDDVEETFSDVKGVRIFSEIK
jgi:hypothetical protein